MKRALFILGTRPEAIKLASLIKELHTRSDRFEFRVCVTGQHREMLDQVLKFFAIKPYYDLNVMKPDQTLFEVTASILEKLEEPIDDYEPDVILVQGDTTTVLTGALAGYYKHIKVGHVEAGLRSGDIYSPFPEEINRSLVSKIAHYHFAPTPRAVDTLIHEGIPQENIYEVGNTVIDALLMSLKIINENRSIDYSSHIPGVEWDKKIILVTGHRRESFGEGFEQICNALKRIADNNREVEVIYPVHLNPHVQEPVNRILGNSANIHLVKPLDYPELIWVMEKSHLVLTDSGGIQEEAPTLGKPVLVMREVTERQEGIDAGTAKLVGTDSDKIYEETQILLENNAEYAKMANAVNPYGDGTAAKQIADILERDS